MAVRTVDPPWYWSRISVGDDLVDVAGIDAQDAVLDPFVDQASRRSSPATPARLRPGRSARRRSSAGRRGSCAGPALVRNVSSFTIFMSHLFGPRRGPTPSSRATSLRMAVFGPRNAQTCETSVLSMHRGSAPQGRGVVFQLAEIAQAAEHVDRMDGVAEIGRLVLGHVDILAGGIDEEVPHDQRPGRARRGRRSRRVLSMAAARTAILCSPRKVHADAKTVVLRPPGRRAGSSPKSTRGWVGAVRGNDQLPAVRKLDQVPDSHRQRATGRLRPTASRGPLRVAGVLERRPEASPQDAHGATGFGAGPIHLLKRSFTGRSRTGEVRASWCGPASRRRPATRTA